MADHLPKDTTPALSAPDPEPRRAADTGGAQLDVATSFLAVILLYFVILILFAASSGEGTADYPYAREMQALEHQHRRQFRSVTPFRRYWLIEADQIAEIDLGFAATLLSEAGSSPAEVTLHDGTQVTLTWGEGLGATGFRLDIRRPKGPGGFMADIGLWSEIQPLAGFATDRPGPGDVVFLRRDAARAALPALDAMTGDGLGPTLRILELVEQSWQMTVIRRRESFELEGGFR